jgi:hypothetical protein
VAERRRRADAGQQRVRPRDLAALEWLADMRAVTAPDLAVLLGRLAGGPALARPGVRNVLARWRRLGLVDVRHVLVGEPVIVTLTSAGGRLAGRDRVFPVAPSLLAHTCAVSRARLWLEAINADRGPSWRSEAELRAELTTGRSWRAGDVRSVPDGELSLADGSVGAVEVELSPKSTERTARTMHARISAGRYARVIYLCGDEGTERIARAAVAEVPRVGAQARLSRSLSPERVPTPRPADLRAVSAALERCPVLVGRLPAGQWTADRSALAVAIEDRTAGDAAEAS